MGDNTRQGGVLSVIMYATLMLEIAKEIKARNLRKAMRKAEKLCCSYVWTILFSLQKVEKTSQKMFDVAKITRLKI